MLQVETLEKASKSWSSVYFLAMVSGISTPFMASLIAFAEALMSSVLVMAPPTMMS